jgi:hypothetical protein
MNSIYDYVRIAALHLLEGYLLKRSFRSRHLRANGETLLARRQATAEERVFGLL